MGFNQGMQPIAGYNFGARQLSRMIQVLKYTTLCAITVTTLGFLICQIFPRTILLDITGDSDLIDIAEHGMRDSFVFPFARFPDGILEFFPVDRDGRKSDFPVFNPPMILLLPVFLSAALLGY